MWHTFRSYLMTVICNWPKTYWLNKHVALWCIFFVQMTRVVFNPPVCFHIMLLINNLITRRRLFRLKEFFFLKYLLYYYKLWPFYGMTLQNRKTRWTKAIVCFVLNMFTSHSRVQMPLHIYWKWDDMVQYVTGIFGSVSVDIGSRFITTGPDTVTHNCGSRSCNCHSRIHVCKYKAYM